MELNKIYNESNLDTMARMPDNFVDCVITSPPYYALRSYGTATTAVVAHRLGRQWVCSELQPKYADIANERLKPYLDQNNLF